MLAKTILERPNKVLEGSWKRVMFKKPVKFLKTVQFCATFNA